MIPLPHDNAQVPKPVQQRAKEKVPAEQLHHRQSEFLFVNIENGGGEGGLGCVLS